MAVGWLLKMFKVGDWVTLKGKTQHGKNRISQHGTLWQVTEIRNWRGSMAVHLNSKNCTFRLGKRMIPDGRWVFLKEDPNFTFEVV